MRTTLTVDDDVLRAAQSMAQARTTTVGKVLSELARKGLRSGRSGTSRNGLPLFATGRNAAPITLELVKQADDES